MSQNNEQFARFTETMKKLVKVPYSEVKAKLEEEKQAKKRKRTRKSKLAAVRALRDKD